MRILAYQNTNLWQKYWTMDIFYGGLDDIQKIDQRLYYKFQANDISEIALLTLYDGEKPAGIIGLSFCNGKKMDKQLVGKHIRSSGIKVATLLSQIKD